MQAKRANRGGLIAIRGGVLIAAVAALGLCKIPAVAAPQGTVLVNNGGRPSVLPSGTALTVGQLAAAHQVATGGRQNLTLDLRGGAVGGSLNLSDVAAPGLQNFAIPRGVNATYDAASAPSLTFVGTLTNAGTLTALSTSSTVNAGTIAANAIVNAPTGIIHSLLSSLTLSAPNIRNAGLITSDTGSLRFTAHTGSPLSIDNTSGTISAAFGTIFANAANNNVTIRGGAVNAQSLDLNAGTGQVTVDVQRLIGTVSTNASAAHVSTNGGTLQVGKVCVSGDPIYLNTNGDVQITGNIDVAEDLTIIASRDVRITNSAVNLIQARDAAGAGHNINIIAGADVTGDATAATIHGASATGGDVNFMNSSTLNISTDSTALGADGGNVMIAAFANGTSGGHVLLPTGSTISAAGNRYRDPNNHTSNPWTNGKTGIISLIAGAPSGIAVSTGNLGSHQITPDLTHYFDGKWPPDVLVATAQPVVGGGSISFAANGQIGNGNSIKAGTPNHDATIDVTGNLRSGEAISLTGGKITQSAGELYAPGIFLQGENFGSEHEPLNVVSWYTQLDTPGDAWFVGGDVELVGHAGGSIHATSPEYLAASHLSAGNAIYLDGPHGYSFVNNISAPLISLSQHDPPPLFGNRAQDAYTGVNATRLLLFGKDFDIVGSNTGVMAIGGKVQNHIYVGSDNGSLAIDQTGLESTNQSILLSAGKAVHISASITAKFNFEAHASEITVREPVLTTNWTRLFANNITFTGTKLTATRMLEAYADRFYFPDTTKGPFSFHMKSVNGFSRFLLDATDKQDFILGRVPHGISVRTEGAHGEVFFKTGGNLYVHRNWVSVDPGAHVYLGAGKIIYLNDSKILAGTALLHETESSTAGTTDSAAKSEAAGSPQDTTITPVDQNRSSIFHFAVTHGAGPHDHHEPGNVKASSEEYPGPDVAHSESRDDKGEYTLDTNNDGDAPSVSYDR